VRSTPQPTAKRGDMRKITVRKAEKLTPTSYKHP
jgi:hypothetical protein